MHNCTLYEVNALEKIQLEAARIVTGATKLLSAWKCYIKKLDGKPLRLGVLSINCVFFYKMNNNISPEYLSSLVPQPVENTTRYGLREVSNIRQPFSRAQLYYKSFLPSSIRL